MPNLLDIVAKRLVQLEALVERLRSEAPRRPISEYYKDIHDLPWEATGWTALRFEGTLSSSSATQPDKVNLRTDRTFYWWGMTGYHNQPGADLTDVAQVTFNITVNTTDKLFHNDQSLAALTTTTGPGPLWQHPRGGYIFPPGATLELTFSRGSSLSATSRIYGVVLVGDYLR